MEQRENPPDGQSPFMKMIEREYNNLIHNYFTIAANQNLSHEDNEDIFHDTIIKCNDIITSKGINDEEEMKSYLFRSLKTNGYRETKYSRNSQREEIDNISDTQVLYPNQEYNIDLDAIYKFIEDKYGDETLDIIKRHLEGYSVREIEEYTGKKGLSYIINKTLKNVKKYFK